MLSIHKVKWQQIGIALLLVAVLLLAGILVVHFGQAEQQADTSWVEIYNETFDSLDTGIWTISEWTSTGYEWGVASYSRDSVSDSGLWAVGGGTQGVLLDWETDTYPAEVLVTLAVAGPFTPTQNLNNVRMSFDVLNKVSDNDDTVTYFISYDGVNPVPGTEQTLAADVDNWQAIAWTPTAVEDRPIWVGFRFFNDGADVDTGPLVDNLILEFEYQRKIYMPFVALQPTLTPTPTPTPIPVFYDDFSDPSSGWFVGDAWRNNYRDRDGDGEKEWAWEIVANMSYITDHYQIYVPESYNSGASNVDTWMVWPAEKAPLPSVFYVAPDQLAENYCIEVQAKFENVAVFNWIQHWGLVFGANADRTELYTLQVNLNHDFAALKYENYEYPGDREKGDRPGLNIEVPLSDWSGNDYGTLITSWDYNTLKAVVNGNQVKLYINDWPINTIWNKAPFPLDVTDMPKAWVGVIGGSWETTPVAVQFNYFEYTTDPSICPELQ